MERHAMSRSREYSSWRNMKKRCKCPGHHRYRIYGGRGIRVCNSWDKSFTAFYVDLGDRPAGCTLDRIDPNGNYEPTNCRWATVSEQNANKRGSKHGRP